MRTFLINLERYCTKEEIENGAYYKKQKPILVQCESVDGVEKEIDIFKEKNPEFKDAKVINTQDWLEIQQAQAMANIQWIMER